MTCARLHRRSNMPLLDSSASFCAHAGKAGRIFARGCSRDAEDGPEMQISGEVVVCRGLFEIYINKFLIRPTWPSFPLFVKSPRLRQQRQFLGKLTHPILWDSITLNPLKPCKRVSLKLEVMRRIERDSGVAAWNSSIYVYLYLSLYLYIYIYIHVLHIFNILIY